MADGTTTNYGLVLPEIGGSDNTWGDKLNANFVAIDAALFNLVLKDGTRPFTGLVTFNSAAGFKLGNFTFKISGTTLQIFYDADLIATLSSAGVLTINDIGADPAL